MFRLRPVMFCAAIALLVAIAMPADAQYRWDRKTTITINAPVRVGDVVLSPGTYVLRLHDVDTSGRRVVQVLSADEMKHYTTVMGLPDFRQEATNETAMTFHEADAGRPAAIQNWFYDSSQFGLEFLDRRGPAQQVAVAEPAVVPEPEPAPIAEVEPAPAPVIEEPAVVPEPEPVTEIAQNVEPEPIYEPEPAPVTELPKTAGGLPLLALSGLLSLGAAVSLRRFMR